MSDEKSWLFRMEWCRKRGLSPADTYTWERSGKAWDEAVAAQDMIKDEHEVQIRKRYVGFARHPVRRYYRYTLTCSCGWTRIVTGGRRVDADKAARDHRKELS